jgi:Uncharacterized protein involved in formate dehydrogenase formation
MVVKVKRRADPGEGFRWCPSCGHERIVAEYRRCYACQKKWNFVYQSCMNNGWPKDLAIKKANDSYPEDGVVLPVSGR